MALELVLIFEKNQKDTKARMEILAEKIKKISKPLGEKILNAIANASLSAMGIPIAIPQQLTLASLGALGIVLSTVKAIKLRPLLTELKALETSYNNAAIAFNVELANQAAQNNNILDDLNDKGFTIDPDTGEVVKMPKNNEDTSGYKVSDTITSGLDSFAKKTGIDRLSRAANISNTQLIGGALLGAIIIYKIKNRNAKKRKK